MKIKLFSRLIYLLTLIGVTALNAQIVNIPDANFKTELVNNPSINTNGDSEIQTSEATAFTGTISVIGKQISDLTGIEAFVNLTVLVCHSNNLTSLDVTQNTSLTALGCSQNRLTSIDVSQNTALTALNINQNHLTSLDVYQNTALTELFVDNNNITSLDVSQNVMLTKLVCNLNQLTSLDVSYNSLLTDLGCFSNQLTSLNVANSNNTNFTFFSASGNPNLTCIQIDNGFTPTTNWNKDSTASWSTNCNPGQYQLSFQARTDGVLSTIGGNVIANPTTGTGNYPDGTIVNLTAAPNAGYQFDGWSGDATGTTNPLSVTMDSDKTIAALFSTTSSNIVHIPDANFKAELVNNTNINTNGDTEIQTAEATAFTGTISVIGKQISDLTGIEAFVNLTVLVCHTNNLTSLDVTQNASLTALGCSQNRLTSIDISQNTALTAFNINDNLLTSIDFSQNTSLTEINVTDNNLTSLNVANGNNTNFTFFSASGNPNLTCIQIDNGFTPPANWGKDSTASWSSNCNPAQYQLNFQVSTDGVLSTTGGNVIASPTTGTGSYPNGSIVTLTATPNAGYQFTGWSGDATSTTNPLSVTMDSDKTITALFSTASNIVHIPDANFKAELVNNPNININGDSEIQTTEATAFTGTISVIGKQISDLTGIEAFVNLTTLVCHNNNLTSLDVSQNTSLTALGCSLNQLTNIDISQNTALIAFNINNNLLTSIDFSQNISLTEINVSDNNLTSLDVTQNTSLTSLWCIRNQLTSLDLSSNNLLTQFVCQSNNQLTNLNVANGNNTNFTSFVSSFNPNLTCITVDDVNYSTANWTNIDSQTSFSTNCNKVWTGTTSTSWSTPSNWSDNSVPSSGENIFINGGIPSGNYPVVTNSTEIQNLTINNGASLTIASTGYIEVTGTLTNNTSTTGSGLFINANDSSSGGLVVANTNANTQIEFNRNVTNQWYILGVVVDGITATDFIQPSNDITQSSSTPTKYAIGEYFTNLSNYAYHQPGVYSITNLNPLKGYAIKRNTPGIISTKGEINNNSVETLNSLPHPGNNWVLMANPYTFHVAVNNAAFNDNFLTTNGTINSVINSTNLAIYTWDQSTQTFTPINQSSSAKYLQPGEAFFVETANSSVLPISFDKRFGVDINNLPAFRATPQPRLKIATKIDGKIKETNIKFFDNTSIGLDPGYDAGVFTGQKDDFNVYSKLLDGSYSNTNFAIQCIKEEDALNNVIPIEVKAKKGSRIEVSAELLNFNHKNDKVLLEDLQTGNITDLKEGNYTFNATANKSKFNIHLSNKTLSNNDATLSGNELVITQHNNVISINNLESKASLEVFDITGKLIESNTISPSKNSVTIENRASGVYIVKVNTAKSEITKKIILK